MENDSLSLLNMPAETDLPDLPAVKPKPMTEYEKLIDRWDEQEILAFMQTPEYRNMPYETRNKPFITSHKLLELERCPYFAKLKYVECLPPPVDTDYEPFVIGTAVDDAITYGMEAFNDRYAAVARRTEKAGKENEGKILLTNGMDRTIRSAIGEYQTRHFFPQTPSKTNVLWQSFDLPCKAELDHFDLEKGIIGDIKTTANIETFDPWNYRFQMAFYVLGVEKRHDIKANAELYVVDKNSDYSRSHKWVFKYETLQMEFGRIMRLMEQWKECQDSGRWPMVDLDTEQGRRALWSSEYYPILQKFKDRIQETIL